MYQEHDSNQSEHIYIKLNPVVRRKRRVRLSQESICSSQILGERESFDRRDIVHISIKK